MKRYSLRHRRGDAFSLVEVAIAIGIVSFVLLAVAGMMGVGLDASKSAQMDTLQAANARAVLANLGTNAYGSFAEKITWINNDGTTNPTADGAMIKAVLSVVTSPSGLRPEMVNDFQLLKVDFIYPAMAPASNQVTNSVYASRAR